MKLLLVYAKNIIKTYNKGTKEIKEYIIDKKETIIDIPDSPDFTDDKGWMLVGMKLVAKEKNKGE